MKREDYYSLTAMFIIGLIAINFSVGNLYENYREGRYIYSAINYNSSVMIGNDTCFTSIYDDTINFTCNGNIIGDVNMTGTLMSNGIYGGMYYHNHTDTTLTFPDGTFTTLFMTNSTHNNGFVFTGGFMVGGNLTATYDGVYNINYYATGKGTNNQEIRLTVFINELIKENCETHWKLPASGDDITMSGNCLLNINAGENISLRIADYSGGGEGIYSGSNLVVTRVGSI